MTSEMLAEARGRLRPYVEQARVATGWSFPVHSRKLRARSWHYDARAEELLTQASAVLDIGTGGGERLARYCRDYRGSVIATEGWGVNVPVATETLRPVGIQVVHCDDEHLPFGPNAFDLVLNRHSGLNPADVARVMKPGATVYTQQVWDHWRELKLFLPRMVEYRGHFRRYREEFARSGLELIDVQGQVVPAAYKNLEEFVFMLCVANWTVPDFDPLGSDLEALLALEAARTIGGELVLSDGAFVIEARKPAEAE
jgi:SAM-dependent methyltransferase